MICIIIIKKLHAEQNVATFVTAVIVDLAVVILLVLSARPAHV